MTLNHATKWHELVQPLINTWTVNGLARADRGWNWPAIWGATKLTTFIGQRPSSFAIVSDDFQRAGWTVPLAMIALVENYVCLDEPGKKAVFLWYVSSLSGLGSLTLPPALSLPKALGAAALDVARVRSYASGLHGRVGLHADPLGGDDLLEFYKRQGMLQLAVPSPRLTLARGNDGRYFYYTPATCDLAHATMDLYR